MKIKLLLGTATIALVSFVGAVHAVVGQEMPDVPQTSVVPVVEAVEQPQVPEFRETVEVETIVTAPAAPVATEKVEQAPIDDRPEWRKYLDEKKTLGGNYAQATECIINWENYIVPARAHLMQPLADFMRQSDSYKDANISDFFNEVSSGIPPCFQSGTLL